MLSFICWKVSITIQINLVQKPYWVKSDILIKKPIHISIFWIGEKFKEALKATFNNAVSAQPSFRRNNNITRSTIRKNNNKDDAGTELRRAATLQDQHIILEVEWEWKKQISRTCFCYLLEHNVFVSISKLFWSDVCCYILCWKRNRNARVEIFCVQTFYLVE